MKGFLKIFGAIMLAGCVFIVGCVAIIGVGANEVAKDIEEEQAKNAITKQQFSKIKLGMTEAEVREIAGPPRDRQDMEAEGIFDEESSKSSCIYYNVKGGEFLDTYQLCFDDDRLNSKNKW